MNSCANSSRTGSREREAIGDLGWEVRAAQHYVAAVRSRLLTLTLVAAVAIAACGSDDDTTSPTTEAAPSTTAGVETTDAPV